MLVAMEENFGPVAPLVRFSDDDEILRMANDTEFGASCRAAQQRGVELFSSLLSAWLTPETVWPCCSAAAVMEPQSATAVNACSSSSVVFRCALDC